MFGAVGLLCRCLLVNLVAWVLIVLLVPITRLRLRCCYLVFLFLLVVMVCVLLVVCAHTLSGFVWVCDLLGFVGYCYLLLWFVMYCWFWVRVG